MFVNENDRLLEMDIVSFGFDWNGSPSVIAMMQYPSVR